MSRVAAVNPANPLAPFPPLRNWDAANPDHSPAGLLLQLRSNAGAAGMKDHGITDGLG